MFAANPAGMVKEQRVSGGSALLPQAEGAEIDSAALTPQSAPFLASADTGTGDVQAAENIDVLYGEGALKDTEPTEKTKTAATANTTEKNLTSGVIYTVVAGDTIQSISASFGIPIDTIIEFNPSVNFSILVPGVSIMIPSPQDSALFAG